MATETSACQLAQDGRITSFCPTDHSAHMLFGQITRQKVGEDTRPTCSPPMEVSIHINHFLLGEISGSHGSECKDGCLLGCCAV
jgi:hypothetical protein